jgi:hypothetical protein
MKLLMGAAKKKSVSKKKVVKAKSSTGSSGGKSSIGSSGGKPSILVIDKYYMIDLDLLNSKPCTSRTCVDIKWVEFKLLNAEGISRAKKRGGWFGGKAMNKYKAKLRQLIIKNCKTQTQKKLWLDKHEEIHEIVKKADAGQEYAEAVGKNIGGVVGGTIEGVVEGTTAGLVGGLTGGFKVSKNTKYIAIGVLALVGVGIAGAGVYSLTKVMKRVGVKS